MPLMQEAIPLEDFERQQRGLPPVKRKVIPKPEPEKPEIENEIKFEDISPDHFVELKSAKACEKRNKDGVVFLGYEVTIVLDENAPLKRRPGRPAKTTEETIKEPQVLIGWMNEGEFLTLVRHFRDRINPNVIHW